MAIVVQPIPAHSLPLNKQFTACNSDTLAPYRLGIWIVKADFYKNPTTLGYLLHCPEFEWGFIGIPHDSPQQRFQECDFFPSHGGAAAKDLAGALMGLLLHFYPSKVAESLCRETRIPTGVS